MCCVHNGIISEDDINDYKKAEIPNLIKNKLVSMEGCDVEVNLDDVKFSEDGEVDTSPIPIN